MLTNAAVGGGCGGTTLLSLSLFGKKSEPGHQQKQQQLGPDIDMIIRESDLLYGAYLIDNVYNLLRRHRSSENPELLWRLARVLCEQGKMSKNPEEKKRLFHEAFEYAEKALKSEGGEGSFGAHKWYAIILNYVAGLEGSKAQLAKSREVKAHWERALEINPLDATTWHLLGLWHFEFANLPSYQRWGASLLYSKPPDTSFEEALRHFERAEAISPNFYSANNYYLGLTYEKLNRLQEAKEQLIKAFQAPVISVDDKEIHDKAFEHLRTQKYKINESELMAERK